MECKEFERMIPSFLDDSLSYTQMEDFQRHMESCAECKEELSIQFMVREGIKHLEVGDAFDMDAEFEAKINKSERVHLRQRNFFNSLQWFITLGLFVAGSILIYLFG